MQSFSGGSGGGSAHRNLQELDMDLWCTQCMWGPPHSYSSCPHQTNSSSQAVYSNPYAYHHPQGVLPPSIQMPPPPSIPHTPQSPYYMTWVSLLVYSTPIRVHPRSWDFQNNPCLVPTPNHCQHLPKLARSCFAGLRSFKYQIMFLKFAL